VRSCLKPSGLVILLIMAAWLAGTSPAARADTPSAARVKNTAEKTVEIDVETQHLMEEWASEELEMLDRIEDLSARLKHTRWQVKKNTTFIRTLEEKIAVLNQQAAQIQEVESQLLPVLDTTLDRLNSFVLSDLPSALDRRRQTIAQTRRMLDDYDTGLLAKTRAVFDTMSREVDLGYSVEVEEQEIETDGGFRQVKLLRVGRIGLFAVTLDGRTGFVWDRSRDRFIPLEESARHLTEAVEMAEGIRLISLSRLPLDLPLAQPDDTGLQKNSLESREPANGGNRAEQK
jgi:hypothetical protein